MSMLRKILKFLSLGNKNHDQMPSNSNILEILESNLSRKKNLTKLENWACNKYLNVSDGISENIYKIVLLSFIFNSKKIYLESMPKLEQKIKDFSNFLYSTNTNLDELNFLFRKKQDKVLVELNMQQYFNDTAYFYIKSLNLLNNIFNQYSDLDICKKLYQDFSSLGLLGNSLTTTGVGTKFLLMIQDDKLSKKDIEIFTEIIPYLDDMIFTAKNFTPSFVDYDIYHKIIVNENNPENLNLLLKYFSRSEKLAKINNPNQVRDYAPVINILNNKIEYLDMEYEMDKKTCIHPSNNKKIKL